MEFYNGKITRDNFEEIFESTGLNKLLKLNEKYIAAKYPVDSTCLVCGDRSKRYLTRILKGQRTPCKNCTHIKKSESFKKGLNYYLDMAEKHYGFKPYSETVNTKYITCNKLTEVECTRCHETLNIKPYSIKEKIENNNNFLCHNCDEKNNEKLSKDDYNNLLDKKFGDIGYVMIEDVSEGLIMDNNYLHKCKVCQYEWSVRASYIKNQKDLTESNRICPSCNNMVRYGDYREWLSENRKDLELIGVYVNRNTPIDHLCKQCNKIWNVRPSNVLSGNNCLHCSGNKPFSKFEDEINNLLVELGITNIIRNSRQVLPSRKELDIYLPDYNLAIEINGLYWHSDKYKDKNYHVNKLNECNSQGIRLLQFYDDDMIDPIRNKIIKDKITHTIGKTKNKIYARNCIIKEVDNHEKNKFLTNNHLQGNDKSKTKLGLFYKDEIVAIITFANKRSSLGFKKDNNSNSVELSRYATKIGTVVIGGFSKLLKYYINSFNPEEIITYADRNISLGNLYDKNGFIFDHYTKPNYFYVDKKKYKRMHRYTFRKNNLENLFPKIYDSNKTEFEIMDSHKDYFRVYNSGNILYKLSI